VSAPQEGGAWRRVALARHEQRPHALDYIRRLAPDFVELHGDRQAGDDPALVAGLGTWRGTTVVLLGQEKGRTLRDRRERNFGMMHPEGYRKAIRLARTAAKFGLPVITLVDTPGAYPGAAAEERGIAGAIASAISEWFRIATPVVSAVIGEGGSGGALGVCVADRVLLQENAIYTVASPEACASIVWRDVGHRQEAAEQLGLTSDVLLASGVVDEVVPEPSGGAHADADEAARLLDEALDRHVRSLRGVSGRLLVRRRYERFRRLGLEVVASRDGVRRDGA
jgi:acetyl-CoA carboxylase carboxyl transferase subunit alpha